MNTRKTQIISYEFTEKQKNNLEKDLLELKYNPNEEYEEFIHQAINRVNNVSFGLNDGIKQFHDKNTSIGVYMIKNTPYEKEVIRGPINPENALLHKNTSISEALLIGLVSQIGEAYNIDQEGQGLISNLSPTQSELNNHTGLGSRKELGFHIEHAAARLLPGDLAAEGLALTGISKELKSSPATVVADGRLALKIVGSKIEDILRDKNRFVIQFPQRWLKDRKELEYLKTAIVFGSLYEPIFIGAFYGKMIKALDSEAASALDFFKEALESVSIDLIIEPGVIVLIDNHYIFHGRRSFEPSFDSLGKSYRWLQRVFWTSDLNRFGHWQCKQGRIFHPTV